MSINVARRPLVASLPAGGRALLAFLLVVLACAGPAGGRTAAAEQTATSGQTAAAELAAATTQRSSGPQPPGVSAPAKPLVFAYYYIWYTAKSWDRAKTDLPTAGKYSSNDKYIIYDHVQAAKKAGIDGFIVSWKHEKRLDDPLAKLVAEAERQNFKLILLYQGLDFGRNPLDPKRIAADMQWFYATYAKSPVFDVWGKPAVVWSGTWKYSLQQIQGVRTAIGAPSKMLLLGSEKSAADYQAKQDVFDGDSYYWSSPDPLKTGGYQKRLDDLASAVHANNGKWIAPAAPGFDARLVGGTTIIERRNGDTFRAAWRGASVSNPDAIGIISWNEFSENSQIEPSQAYGTTYLELTRQLTGAASAPPQSLPVDTSTPAPAPQGPIDTREYFAASAAGGVAVLAAIVAVSIFVVIMRRRRGRTP